ncbi:thioredoxin family protein [Aureispira]|nr:thioredoxin family protein [Aureispira sp.]
MTLDEFKDVLKLNKLAITWITDFKKNNLGAHCDKLKKQYKEMKLLKSKTDKLIEKQAGDSTSDKDWKSLYKEIEKLAKESPVFKSCIDGAGELISKGTIVSKETGMLAIKLKKLSSSWFGQFSDDVKDEAIKNKVMTIHEQSKKVLAAPKNNDGNMVVLEFYGSKSKSCRKMRKHLEFIADEHSGMIDVEMALVENNPKLMHKLKIENLPAIIFKRGNKKIALHQGNLSLSAIQQKIAVLMTGANISDSNNVGSIKGLKKINQKELYGMGEFLLFYFKLPQCGICNKTDEVIEKIGRKYSKIKFESIMVDGSHKLHRSFGVTHVPSIVFVRLGKVIGKHIGYINPSNLEEKMDKFASSAKTSMGVTDTGESRLIPGEKVED